MTPATSSFAHRVAEERRPAPGSPADARHYVKLWQEPESLDGERVSAFVLILRTRGCYWADVKGCTMCGYARDTLGRSATEEEIGLQLTRALTAYRGEPYVKIYTSGSFLDAREVPEASRAQVAKAFAGRARRLLVETLPEFASLPTLEALRESFGGTLEVALGLESTQPRVLAKAVHKHETPTEYLGAADRVRRAGASPKAYLLLKPPYLTEREAIEDTVTSVARASEHFDTLSVNPVHLQGGTVVEHLFRRGLYRPPWLWSLLEVLSRGSRLRAPGTRLVSFPTSGGNPRGVHNCLRCDPALLARVQETSLTQDFSRLDDLPECACRETWRHALALEGLAPEA